MEKYKRRETSLQKRGRSPTPNHHQEEDTSYSHQMNTSSRRSEKQALYFQRERSLLNRDRSRSSYSQRERSRDRSRSSYSLRERSRDRSESLYSQRERSPLVNRDRGRAPYSQHESSINRDQTPCSQREDLLRQTNFSLNTREKEREGNAGEGSRSRKRDQEEIAELRLAMSNLIREVKELRDEKEALHQTGNQGNQSRIHSLSPDRSSTRYNKVRKTLEPMNHEYKRAFRDEVVQILKGLDDSLAINHENRWTDIETHVIQNIMPVIKRALGDRFQYNDTELKKVLQTLHRHRRDAHTISMDPLKSKANKQRTGTNTRRKDKKERRQRGFHHMVKINDQMLVDLQPSSMPWNNWIEDLEEVINNSGYHSDEVSESDTEKVQEEKNENIRPPRKENSNHVLHVYDKQWRSNGLRKFLRYADSTGESIQNVKVGRKRWYDDQLYIENSSKPPRNAPEWAITTSYYSG